MGCLSEITNLPKVVIFPSSFIKTKNHPRHIRNSKFTFKYQKFSDFNARTEYWFHAVVTVMLQYVAILRYNLFKDIWLFRYTININMCKNSDTCITNIEHTVYIFHQR